LEGDADDHLAQRGARDSVSAAQSLRAEQDVDAERAALPDDAVQQQGGGLGDLVVFHEEFLELINHEQ
jgi:hypothetical protein